MTNLLLRLLFGRDYDPEAPKTRAAIGRLAGITGIVCNLALFAAKLVELREDCDKEPLLRTPLQVLQIGETAWATVPAELFVKLGMEVKLGSPVDQTYIAAYTNGMVGYVCTPEAYEHGGYEATPCGGSRVDPGAGAVIVDGMLNLLKQL